MRENLQTFWQNYNAIIIPCLITLLLGWFLRDILPKLWQLAKKPFIVIYRLGSGSIFQWWAFRRYKKEILKRFSSKDLFEQAERGQEVEKLYIPLRVNKEYEPSGSKSFTKEKILEVDAFELLVGEEKKIIVLGDAGTGKTTLLKFLARSFAKKGKRRAGLKLIPVYLELKKFAKSGKNFVNYLEEIFSEFDFYRAGKFIERNLKKGRFLILLDGLDEVVDEGGFGRTIDEIKKFAGKHLTEGSNCLFLTSRGTAYRGQLTSVRFLEVGMMPFGPEQVKEFIQSRLSEKLTKGLLKEFDEKPHLKRLAETPLLLSIMVTVYKKDHNLPQWRVELYDRCVELLLSRRDEARGIELKFPVEKKRYLLRKLAFDYHKEGIERFTFIDLEQRAARFLENIGKRPEEAEGYIQEIIDRSNLISPRRVDEYDFLHRTFQEYFAAWELVEKKDFDFLVEHLEDKNWHLATLFVAGKLEEATDFIKKIMPNNLFFAGLCLAETDSVNTTFKRDLVEALIRHFEEKKEDHKEAYEVLIKIGDDSISEYFKDRFQKATSLQEKELSAKALVQIGKPSLLNYIKEYFDKIILGGKDEIIRQEGIELAAKVLCPPGMAYVPAGEFMMGEDKKRTHLKAFCIGRFPVTNVEYKRFMDATGHEASGHWKGGRIPKSEENRPVGYVSWYDATDYAKWAGKRLPTEEEWEKAARGIDGRAYPWGDEFDSAKCNTYESGVKGTTPVDKYPEGVSFFGCYDMAGNVWEWTNSWYDEDVVWDWKDQLWTIIRWPLRIFRRFPMHNYRVLRGGSWRSNQVHARCAYRFYFHPDYDWDDYGFRCAEDIP